MVRKFLEWSDKKLDESVEKDNMPVFIAKAAGLGFLDGAIDGLVVWSTMFLAVSAIALITQSTSNNKQ